VSTLRKGHRLTLERKMKISNDDKKIYVYHRAYPLWILNFIDYDLGITRS
jgi:hypothetical protein